METDAKSHADNKMQRSSQAVLWQLRNLHITKRKNCSVYRESAVTKVTLYENALFSNTFCGAKFLIGNHGAFSSDGQTLKPQGHARNPTSQAKTQHTSKHTNRDKNFKGSKTPHVCDAQLKLLISPINETEALEAIHGGAEIIDVKNPLEGALGANYPWVIKNIKQLIPAGTELSCAIGDVPNLPGSVSLAAYGAATLGVDYIKVGLYGFTTQKDAIYLLQQVCKAAKTINPTIKVVATGYADAQKIGTLNPNLIPEIAKTAGADIAMLDTATKNGTTLFTYQTTEQLETFIQTAHKNGLQAALAGSLRKQDIPAIYKLGADIVGLRGAACTNNDRNIGHITSERVKELVDAIQGAGKA